MNTRKELDNLQAHLSEHVPPSMKVVVLGATADEQCELCHKMDEVRPYGPNGEKICPACGDLDKIGTVKRVCKKMFGEDISDEKASRIAELWSKYGL
jgi:hypothetical protein